MTAADFDRWLLNPHRRPLVMGILNVTPDSFSDGGLYADHNTAAAHAAQMAGEGAELIDIGGESTRPGSLPVPVEEQIARVVPVIERIRKESDVAISIDTTRVAVAEAALNAGASIINDISAARDDEQMLPLAASRHCPIVLMHMQGTPRTMQQSPHYDDVVGEVCAFLQGRGKAAEAAGVAKHRILLDPGIGFGKLTEHNLLLLRQIDEVMALGWPVLVGTSRKRFIGQITGKADASQRRWGTAATVAWCAARKVGILRVHDVAPMVQVVRMIEAIRQAN